MSSGKRFQRDFILDNLKQESGSDSLQWTEEGKEREKATSILGDNEGKRNTK